jgi:hypothetical protein
MPIKLNQTKRGMQQSAMGPRQALAQSILDNVGAASRCDPHGNPMSATSRQVDYDLESADSFQAMPQYESGYGTEPCLQEQDQFQGYDATMPAVISDWGAPVSEEQPTMLEDEAAACSGYDSPVAHEAPVLQQEANSFAGWGAPVEQEQHEEFLQPPSEQQQIELPAAQPWGPPPGTAYTAPDHVETPTAPALCVPEWFDTLRTCEFQLIGNVELP